MFRRALRSGVKFERFNILSREANICLCRVNGKVPAIAGDVPVKLIMLFEKSDLTFAGVADRINVYSKI